MLFAITPILLCGGRYSIPFQVIARSAGPFAAVHVLTIQQSKKITSVLTALMHIRTIAAPFVDPDRHHAASRASVSILPPIKPWFPFCQTSAVPELNLHHELAPPAYKTESLTTLPNIQQRYQETFITVVSEPSNTGVYRSI